MIVILSTSHPTVSAIVFTLHDRSYLLVDSLDHVVALLIQLVDRPLGFGHGQIVREPRFVLFVPELDVRLREARDEFAQGVCHDLKNSGEWGVESGMQSTSQFPLPTSHRPLVFRPMSEPRLDRIAIVMMSAAGDAVHTLPVVNALKRHRPQAHITWILQPGPATLVQGHRNVDEIILFDRSRGMRALTDIRRTLAAKAFDLVINLQVY